MNTDEQSTVNVIIFLAPLSCFNQMLAEDETVNRLVSGAMFLSRGAQSNMSCHRRIR